MEQTTGKKKQLCYTSILFVLFFEVKEILSFNTNANAKENDATFQFDQWTLLFASIFGHNLYI